MSTHPTDDAVMLADGDDYEVLEDLVGDGGEADGVESDGSSLGEEIDAHSAEPAGTSGQDDSIHDFEGHVDCVLAVAWSPAHPDLVATGKWNHNAV
jgi:hypothetical protein